MEEKNFLKEYNERCKSLKQECDDMVARGELFKIDGFFRYLMKMGENKMKYERLTKQNWHNAKFSINTEANNRIFLHRLWVLENRIENLGTLPDKRDYNRITDRRDLPLVMSQWAGSPDDLAVYNRLWELENRIENDEFNK